jgi:hypothetical protein
MLIERAAGKRIDTKTGGIHLNINDLTSKIIFYITKKQKKFITPHLIGQLISQFNNV